MTFSSISFSVFLGSLESDLRIATCLFIRLFGLSYLKMIEPAEMNLGFNPKKQQSMCVYVHKSEIVVYVQTNPNGSPQLQCVHKMSGKILRHGL